MAKRPSEVENTDRPPKRARPDHPVQPAQPPEEIHFARQLQDLLVFRQDGVQQLRHGIASFKAFLESILYHREEDNRGRQLSILREFLDTQKPADPSDTDRPLLGQLWQAWSFANQNNNDHLASSLCAIFALALKTLSSLLDLREYGSLLCRTILQHQHLRLIKRCLDAPKHKDFLISPSLRLLTELTGFDGGVFAREVYKRREQTFDLVTLRRNLGLFKTEISKEDARRKPALRTLTVRYVLAHLKYQAEGGKIDILKQRPLCNSLFSYIREDPAELVVEILRTSEQHVFKDKTLPRSAKAALLTQQHLERVTEIATRLEIDESTSKIATDWLKSVSTVPSYGILRPSAWYPPGTTKPEHLLDSTGSTINLGLDSLDFYDHDESFQVRNTTLLSWIQTLRPHTDVKERELALACFEAAPELVHAYFRENAVQLDPKLTNTWVGYASFAFEVVRLPVPPKYGHTENEEHAEIPPQVSIIMDSITPKPFTHKVLARCLNQSNALIRFFAIRLLVLAFQKLADVRKLLAPGASKAANLGLWHEASERLSTQFTQRCPPMKDVINAFRQTPDDEEHILQREAVARLLSQYYEITPLQALEEQFDVSGPLTAALIREESVQGDAVESKAMRSLELEHLLSVAKHSTGMRWFHTQGGLKHSPFVTLLRLHTKNLANTQVRQILGDVLYENGLLDRPSSDVEPSPLDALIASLVIRNFASDAPWIFLDDCLSRGSRQPVKYLDAMDSKKDQVGTDTAVPSVLLQVFLEQASFAKEDADVLTWLRDTFLLFKSTSNDGPLLDALTKSLLDTKGVPKGGNTEELQRSLQKVRLRVDVPVKTLRTDAQVSQDATLSFPSVPVELDDHPELLRWQQKDLDIAIEEGAIDALVLCLCSKHADIRLQARMQLRTLITNLAVADIETRDQMQILVGELIETYEQYSLEKPTPLPYLVGTFAARSLHVLADPTHFIYPKLNRYLMKDPHWRISKMPTYWLENTILSQPEEDDAYWKEVQWVLDWLVDGLRTQGDLDLLRRSNAFEKVMALYSSPAASEKFVRMKVLELVYRGACVNANTLVTRTGCLSWLKVVEETTITKLLRALVHESSDGARLQEWAGSSVV